MPSLEMLKEYEESGEKVFILRNFIEIRIPLKTYNSLIKRREKGYIISQAEPRRVLCHVTRRNLVFVSKESGIPLMGSSAFGIIDRGTNLIQIRPVTGCNLRCIFCSVDEGRNSKTRLTDYVVEPNYLLEWVDKVSKFKGGDVEAHIDGQGEPFLYPYMEEFLRNLSRIKEIKVISIQTNGILLSEEKIERLEDFVTRINLSLSSLNEEKASKLAGLRYPLKRVIEVAKAIAESKIDLLIAPVWVPGYNDSDMEEIIEFAMEIGAGKKYPPLGIQKYIPYKFGRKLKNVISFREFYRKLEEWEKEYDVRLILSPEDFGMHKCRKFPHQIRKGDVFKARIVSDGRMYGERLVVVKDRVVTIKTEHKIDDFVRFKIVRSKDGIFLGEILD
jgi:hypothetical protein